MENGTSVQILALGDSITWGWNDPSGCGYRCPLSKQLNESIFNGGFPGYAISDLPDLTYLHPHIVLLDIGTNDVGRNIDLANITARLKGLIDSYLAAGAIVIFSDLARVSGTVPTNINIEYQALADQYAAQNRPVYIVHISQVLTEDSDYSDPTHPSLQGYQKMAKAWFQTIKEIL